MMTERKRDCIKRNFLSTVSLNPFSQVRIHGPLNDFNAHSKITGPCGDTMEYWLFVKNSTIERISFVTDGCGYSSACGNMCVCLTEGLSVQVASSLEPKDILDQLPGLPPEHEHCAVLAANTIKAACDDYENRSERAEK